MHTQFEQDVEKTKSPKSKQKASAKIAIDLAIKKPRGLTIERLLTKEGVHPCNELRWEKRKTVISNPDGSVVFQMDNAEIPEGWSQLATDIAVSKYFRKAGVPGTGRETSVKQLVKRVAHTIRKAG